MESKKYKFNKQDLVQIAIKAGMLFVALVLPSIIEEVKLVDFGEYQSYATGVIFVLQYGVQRFVSGK